MKVLRLAAALALAAVAGCSNTKVARQWADPALREGAYGKALVIVLGTPFNRRQTAEERVVAELARGGVSARRSWDLLPQEALGDRARLAQVVESEAVDAVLALHVVSVKREVEVTEGRQQWVPVATNLDYYGYVSTTVALYRKPEITETRTFQVETTLWDVASRRLVWSAESVSTTANQTITTAELTDDYAQVVAKRVVPYLRHH